MTQSFKHRQIPAGNPVANILVVVVGAIVIAVSFVLGIVAFVALVAALVVMVAVIAIRVWWLNRRLGKRAKGDDPGAPIPRSDPTVIEGEYRIVSGEGGRKPADRT